MSTKLIINEKIIIMKVILVLHKEGWIEWKLSWMIHQLNKELSSKLKTCDSTKSVDSSNQHERKRRKESGLKGLLVL